ncbi:MAG TPA: DedA family protein [Ktedonobacterales bacterium]|nr:DedA family protein [Ktedonobacterales bacterium]
MNLPSWLQQGIDTYGYWVVFLAVAIESTGIPFPGETTLVAASVYASTNHTLNIVLVIAAAAAGAILGDNAGYTVGKYGGFPVLQRLLRLLHVGEDKLVYTQRFFEKHGDKTVFFGRFLAVLRAWAAFLAGANHMRRRAFFIWNAAGGILWATIYGLLGYILGNNLPLLGRILKGLGIFGFVALGVVVVALIVVWYMRHRRQEEAIQRIAAERNTPASDSSNASPDTPVPAAAPTAASSPDHNGATDTIDVTNSSQRSRHTRRRQAYR